jgi:hypothetical protein
MAARMITAATAAATRVALTGPADTRPGATEVAKIGGVPIDLIVRLTFICQWRV